MEELADALVDALVTLADETTEELLALFPTPDRRKAEMTVPTDPESVP